MTDLLESVRNLLEWAHGQAQDAATQARLVDVTRRLDGPLRVAIAGRVKAGKSTLLNALVGEELAPTDAGECTKVVTWYVGAERPQAIIHRRDGTFGMRPYQRDGGSIDVDLGVPVEAVDHLEIRWPTSRLRDVTLIDTPGIASLSAEVSARASVVLGGEGGGPSVADAVLYLLRHAHSSDVRFLEAFHDDEFARGSPVNAVGVLSRADEVGACRRDALEVAARIAARYTTDIRMRRVCPLVIPVAGLLAQAGVTLREEEFRALAVLAALTPRQTDDLMLTAGRFCADDHRLPLTSLERRHLLDRLGLFGVRLAVDLVRAGQTPSANLLGRRLTADGGLDRLRQVLLHQFTARSRVLQVRSALAVLRAVAASRGVRDPGRLQLAIDEVTASAHDLVEIRLLDELRSGVLAVRSDLAAEMDRLLGGSGYSPADRLGLPPDASRDAVRAAALAALGHWQRLAESPIAERTVRTAARAVGRTCEGIVAGAG